MEAEDPQRECRVGVAYGYESELYSFPDPHPMNNERIREFVTSLRRMNQENPRKVQIFKSVSAQEEDLLLFHTKEYVDLVRNSSRKEEEAGYLDYGDTPAYKGVYEASVFVVGNTLNGLKQVLEAKHVDHFFNPVGGLHHARPERAGGFCVFNDCSIAIARAIKELNMKQVAYVDIDAHHGDGVFYGFESEPRVVIGDIHEDGRFLYPGTGFADETGRGEARGTKLNIPLSPSSNDQNFVKAFDQVESFLRKFKPEVILLQCGADGLDGDPLTHLAYTSKAHSYAARKLHIIAHEVCGGRILAMGGGGYNSANVNSAWSAVVRELSSSSPQIS